ncbi:MAG TPA: hemolysin family protein [Acidobacteriota bacterium]|nr:hemolysin family protein [Acidobacteriota bacterium]
MDEVDQWLLIAIALFLVFLNGYFVASEFAIVKVRRTRIQELIHQGRKRAISARRMIDNMDEYLSATQLGITLASLGLGWIGEPAFARLFEPLVHAMGPWGEAFSHTASAAIAFLLITFLHIVLGELAPKSLAIQRAEPVILWGSGLMHFFYKISYPFIWSLNGTANILLKAFGVTPVGEQEEAHSEEELKMILAHSHQEGILEGDERKLLERVLSFSDRSVRQVMVPSPEVVFLDSQKSLDENLSVARQRKHTRYLLCEGSLESVKGVIHTKDLFWMMRELGEDFELSMARRPVHFVPDSKPIKSLLPEFRRTRTHLAVAVDEYGSMVGIVTLEDILEELVGEIQDEFDPAAPAPDIRPIDHDVYLVHGRTLLSELEEELSVDLSDDENDTAAGHVMMLLGRTAEVGDEVKVGQRFKVRVLGIKGFQITDLRFERLPEPKHEF